MVKRFYNLILDHPKTVIGIFVVIVGLCLLMRNQIVVNYDMKDYLPDGTPSTKSMEALEDEFDGGIPNARIMIKDLSIAEALKYKKQIEDTDGVDGVHWLDDVADVNEPLEFIDENSLETYYKDGDALFVVTVNEHKKIRAVSSFRDIIGDDGYMSGEAVSTAFATTSTIKEIQKITLIAIAFLIFILLLTSSSWIEPVIILTTLGFAIAINAGTNLIFGEISFVTNAAGNILLLAVSLDYSVFLMHRYEECKFMYTNPKTALREALKKSSSSILSSGFTTVTGFMALVFMRFKLGPDLGLALAKGIAISLITVFVFMPALVILLYKIVDKTRHNSILPSFDKFGKFVSKVMLPCALILVIVIIPSFLASNSNFFQYGSSSIFGEETMIGKDTKKIEEAFGQKDTYVLMVPKGNIAKESELSIALNKIPQVESIVSYVDTVGEEIPTEYPDKDKLSDLISDNYSRMVLNVDVDYEGEETFALVEEVRDTANEYYSDKYYLAGEGVSTYDLMDTTTADTLKVNLIAIGAVFLVLLIVMKSATLPVILVLCIETAIWINLAIPYFTDSPVYYIAYLIISSIQLGATVDYAILYTDRYLGLRKNMDRKNAVINTTSAVTVSMLVSGLALTVVGFLLGYMTSHGLLSQLGILIGRGATLSLAIVLFALPGCLYILDRVIKRTTIGGKQFYEEPEYEPFTVQDIELDLELDIAFNDEKDSQ